MTRCNPVQLSQSTVLTCVPTEREMHTTRAEKWVDTSTAGMMEGFHDMYITPGPRPLVHGTSYISKCFLNKGTSTLESGALPLKNCQKD